MSAPRVDQINVVVSDLAAAAQLLRELGVEVQPTPPEWEPHHQTLPPADRFDVDLDGSAFASHWGGLPAGFTGAVVTVRVDDRPEVDRLHEVAQAAGARSLKAPYDAFWGARYAVVEGPGSIVIGLMSVADAAYRTAGPEPADFA